MADRIEALKERLRKGNTKSVIIPHMSADGDAVGSCCALYGVLTKAGIDCTIITPDDFPEYLRWLKNADTAVTYRKKVHTCDAYVEKADLIFMLDHNSPHREGELERTVADAKAEKIIIDHHPHPDQVDYLISDTSVSSTCELLYLVIDRLWGKGIVDKDIANALYLGINTDTGGLSHNSSSPQTYRVVAELLEKGLEKDLVHEKIYQTNTLSRLRLLGNSLLNKLVIHPKFPLAVIPITLEELNYFDYKEGDLEGLVNVPLSIADVKVSVQITQRKERIKLSFRSKGDVPVNEWAGRYFNGGGHLNAAGGQMETSLDEVVDLVNKTAEWFFTTYGGIK